MIYVNGEYIQNNEEWKEFKKEYDFEQTPTLMLLKEGKQVSKLDWDENHYISEKDFDNWLSKNMDTIKNINI